MGIVGLVGMQECASEKADARFQLLCLNRNQNDLLGKWLSGEVPGEEVQARLDDLTGKKIILEKKLDLLEEKEKMSKDAIKSWAESFGPLFPDEDEEKEIIREVVYVTA